MRIAHVTDCFLPRLGGIELQVDDLARRQSGLHDVTVYTSTRGPDPSDGAPIRVARVSAGRGEPEKIRYAASDRGRRLVSAGGFDLVHVHASSFSPLAFLTARDCSLRGVPTVATVHSLWAKATPLFVGADRLAGWGDWPVIWSAVSNAAAAPMRRVLRDRASVAILPNGVDPAEWRVAPQPGREDLRIAVVCRLAPRKRPLPLLRILSRARRRIPPGVSMSVDVIGDGPERPHLERFLRSERMEGWVHLLGRRSRSEIRGAYARANLFVAPAHLESFGIAALEARCAGLPILALAGTGVADFVRHGREGWLVDSDRALLETLVSLATSPGLLDRVGAHNRTVEPAINWTGVLAGCESLYRTAAHLHGRDWSPAADAAGSLAAER